jgi:hypothetical protein
LPGTRCREKFADSHALELGKVRQERAEIGRASVKAQEVLVVNVAEPPANPLRGVAHVRQNRRAAHTAVHRLLVRITHPQLGEQAFGCFLRSFM